MDIAGSYKSSGTGVAICIVSLIAILIHFEIDQATPQIMTKILEKADVVATTVNPGDIVDLPWGWCCAEECINNAEVFGLRFMVVRDSTSDEFDFVSKMLVPDDATDVPSGSAAAFVVSVHKAINKALPTDGSSSVISTVPALGSKCIWMSRGYFLEVKRDEEFTELEALQEFENQWESLPSSRKQGQGKARRILWPENECLASLGSVRFLSGPEQ